MASVTILDWDRSGISRVYANARALPEDALHTWRMAIRECVPREFFPIRTVADVGCGTGRFASALASVFDARIIGIEPAAAMREVAMAQSHDDRCSFLPGKLELLPLRDQSMDMVFLSMVFHHVTDWSAAQRELHRVLRNRGVVLIRTALREALDACLWCRFFPTAAQSDTRRLPSRSLVVDRMRLMGFELARHRRVLQRFADTKEDYLRKISLRGLSGLRLIPDDDFQRGVANLADYLHQQNPPAHEFDEQMDLFCFQLADVV